MAQRTSWFKQPRIAIACLFFVGLPLDHPAQAQGLEHYFAAAFKVRGSILPDEGRPVTIDPMPLGRPGVTSDRLLGEAAPGRARTMPPAARIRRSLETEPRPGTSDRRSAVVLFAALLAAIQNGPASLCSGRC